MLGDEKAHVQGQEQENIGFAQELKNQLAPAGTGAFPNGDLLDPLGRACGGQIDIIDTGYLLGTSY